MKVKKENVDLLKEWDGIRQSVKRGLKRLGHDILLVCMEPEDKKRKRK